MDGDFSLLKLTELAKLPENIPYVEELERYQHWLYLQCNLELYLMHHAAGIQFGQGSMPSAHQQFSTTEIPVPSSATTTAQLRQCRKKDPTGEKPAIHEPRVPETQGPVARVAPLAHYPRSAESFRYPQQYVQEYGIQYKDLTPAPVKYSEIVEPSTSSHHLNGVIQKPKENIEMFTMQQQQMKAYAEPVKHAYPNMYPQKESHIYKEPNFNQYMYNYKVPSNQYPHRHYPTEPNFSYLPEQQMYPMDQRQVYQNQRIHRQAPIPMSNFRPTPQSYPQNYNYRAPIQNHDPYRMHPYQNYKIPQHLDPMATNLSRVRMYPENIQNYPQNRNSPNYNCGNLEYAQHYQNRTRAVPPEYMQYVQQLPQLQEGMLPDGSQKSPSLKQYLETWNDDISEISDPNKDARKETQSLYILDATEVPTEKVQQFIHLKVDKLPENIKGFLAPQETVIRQNNPPAKETVISETKKFIDSQKMVGTALDEIISEQSSVIVFNNDEKKNQENNSVIRELKKDEVADKMDVRLSEPVPCETSENTVPISHIAPIEEMVRHIDKLDANAALSSETQLPCIKTNAMTANEDKKQPEIPPDKIIKESMPKINYDVIGELLDTGSYETAAKLPTNAKHKTLISSDSGDTTTNTISPNLISDIEHETEPANKVCCNEVSPNLDASQKHHEAKLADENHTLDSNDDNINEDVTSESDESPPENMNNTERSPEIATLLDENKDDIKTETDEESTLELSHQTIIIDDDAKTEDIKDEEEAKEEILNTSTDIENDVIEEEDASGVIDLSIEKAKKCTNYDTVDLTKSSKKPTNIIDFDEDTLDLSLQHVEDVQTPISAEATSPEEIVKPIEDEELEKNKTIFAKNKPTNENAGEESAIHEERDVEQKELPVNIEESVVKTGKVKPILEDIVDSIKMKAGISNETAIFEKQPMEVQEPECNEDAKSAESETESPPLVIDEKKIYFDAIEKSLSEVHGESLSEKPEEEEEENEDRLAVVVNGNYVLLQIAGELVEINLINSEGKKMLSVVPLTECTVVTNNNNNVEALHYEEPVQKEVMELSNAFEEVIVEETICHDDIIEEQSDMLQTAEVMVEQEMLLDNSMMNEIEISEDIDMTPAASPCDEIERDKRLVVILNPVDDDTISKHTKTKKLKKPVAEKKLKRITSYEEYMKKKNKKGKSEVEVEIAEMNGTKKIQETEVEETNEIIKEDICHSQEFVPNIDEEKRAKARKDLSDCDFKEYKTRRACKLEMERKEEKEVAIKAKKGTAKPKKVIKDETKIRKSSIGEDEIKVKKHDDSNSRRGSKEELEIKLKAKEEKGVKVKKDVKDDENKMKKEHKVEDDVRAKEVSASHIADCVKPAEPPIVLTKEVSSEGTRFVNSKHNFSIIAKEHKEKTKIRTPARNKRFVSLMQDSLPQESKILSVKTKAELKEQATEPLPLPKPDIPAPKVSIPITSPTPASPAPKSIPSLPKSTSLSNSKDLKVPTILLDPRKRTGRNVEDATKIPDKLTKDEHTKLTLEEYKKKRFRNKERDGGRRDDAKPPKHRNRSKSMTQVKEYFSCNNYLEGESGDEPKLSERTYSFENRIEHRRKSVQEKVPDENKYHNFKLGSADNQTYKIEYTVRRNEDPRLKNRGIYEDTGKPSDPRQNRKYYDEILGETVKNRIPTVLSMQEPKNDPRLAKKLETPTCQTIKNRKLEDPRLARINQKEDTKKAAFIEDPPVLEMQVDDFNKQNSCEDVPPVLQREDDVCKKTIEIQENIILKKIQNVPEICKINNKRKSESAVKVSKHAKVEESNESDDADEKEGSLLSSTDDSAVNNRDLTQEIDNIFTSTKRRWKGRNNFGLRFDLETLNPFPPRQAAKNIIDLDEICSNLEGKLEDDVDKKPAVKSIIDLNELLPKSDDTAKKDDKKRIWRQPIDWESDDDEFKIGADLNQKEKVVCENESGISSVQAEKMISTEVVEVVKEPVDINKVISTTLNSNDECKDKLLQQPSKLNESEQSVDTCVEEIQSVRKERQVENQSKEEVSIEKVVESYDAESAKSKIVEENNPCDKPSACIPEQANENDTKENLNEVSMVEKQNEEHVKEPVHTTNDAEVSVPKLVENVQDEANDRQETKQTPLSPSKCNVKLNLLPKKSDVQSENFSSVEEDFRENNGNDTGSIKEGDDFEIEDSEIIACLMSASKKEGDSDTPKSDVIVIDDAEMTDVSYKPPLIVDVVEPKSSIQIESNDSALKTKGALKSVVENTHREAPIPHLNIIPAVTSPVVHSRSVFEEERLERNTFSVIHYYAKFPKQGEPSANPISHSVSSSHLSVNRTEEKEEVLPSVIVNGAIDEQCLENSKSVIKRVQSEIIQSDASTNLDKPFHNSVIKNCAPEQSVGAEEVHVQCPPPSTPASDSGNNVQLSAPKKVPRVDENTKTNPIPKCVRFSEETIEINGKKRCSIDDISRKLMHEKATKSSDGYVSTVEDLKLQIKKTDNLKLVIKRVPHDKKPRKRKRFRNLQGAESDNEDYFESKLVSGLPRLIVRRRTSETHEEHLQPVVRIERDPKLDSLAKKKRKN